MAPPFSPSVPLGAPKRASSLAPDVARRHEKKDPAMPAPGQAWSQLRSGPQHRSQQRVVLKDQPRDYAGPIPIGLEPKMLLDLDCKKPKHSLRMLLLE
jgi:hypothetical protein